MLSNCIDHNLKGDRDGYGCTKRHPFNRLTLKSHRIAYCVHHGIDIAEIDGLLIRHKCDNPRCINPDHLETGTQSDNMQDMVSRNRSAKGVKSGKAVLTKAQVRYIKRHYRSRCKINGATPMARRLGVHYTTIVNIAHGRNKAEGI